MQSAPLSNDTFPASALARCDNIGNVCVVLLATGHMVHENKNRERLHSKACVLYLGTSMQPVEIDLARQLTYQGELVVSYKATTQAILKSSSYSNSHPGRR